MIAITPPAPSGETGSLHGPFEVGDDLLDDGMGPVGGFGVEHRQWAVGEYRVVAVGGEQLALVVRVHVFDPAHDQPGGHVLGFRPGGERGVTDLGDFGVGDPPLPIFVEDGVGVFDRRPGLFIDRRDRFADRRVLACGDGEMAAVADGAR